MRCALFLLILSIFPVLGSPLLEARRIVFLGDSVTWAGGHIADLEAYLELAHPDPERVILNLGLPSETVSGLSENGHARGKFPRPDLAERLERVLDQTKPDLIVAAYGINCAIYQSFDPERFQSFQKGMTALIDEAKKRGIKLLLLTPWPYDSAKGKKILADYNQTMAKYAAWIKKSHHHVFDVHAPMTAELAKRRKTDPNAAFTRDGIHMNAAGEEFATALMLKLAGSKDSPAEFFAKHQHAADLRKLTRERMTILRDSWLTATGHKRPRMKVGLAPGEASIKAAALTKKIQSLR